MVAAALEIPKATTEISISRRIPIVCAAKASTPKAVIMKAMTEGKPSAIRIRIPMGIPTAAIVLFVKLLILVSNNLRERNEKQNYRPE